MAAEINFLKVIFSFNIKLDMRDAQTGEVALKEVALEIPMDFTPNKNKTPPIDIVKIPEIANNIRFVLDRFSSLFHKRDNISRNAQRKGNLSTFAKMTSIFLKPIVIKIEPIDHDNAVIKAKNIPELSLLLFMAPSLINAFAIPRNIMIVPIKYFKRNNSSRNKVAKNIVYKGKV